MATEPVTARTGAPDPSDVARRRGLRAVLHRLVTSQEQLDAVELEDQALDSGANRIRECACGVPATVVGRLRTVTLRPGAQTPAVEAQLYDGTGEITLLFLGRRRIPGITVGRRLSAHGRPIVRDGVRTMVNPRYELLPTGAE